MVKRKKGFMCWKKGFHMPSSISYHNSMLSREIQIVKTDYGNRGTFGRKRTPKWTVFKFKGNKPIPIIKDKSKSTALKFAKSYMRKHDKC